MESAWWGPSEVVVAQGFRLGAVWRRLADNNSSRRDKYFAAMRPLLMSLNRFHNGNKERHVMAPGSTYCHRQWRADESSLIASNCQQESKKAGDAK